MEEFSEKYPAAYKLTTLMIEAVKEKMENNHGRFHLAISGGNSPLVLFRLWREMIPGTIFWDRIELYWVDERCVPPLDKASNYGDAKRHLLDFISLKNTSVHRIIGEADPAAEAERYSALVRDKIPVVNGFPEFDLIIAGIGSDGHTSSVFPGQDHLLSHPSPYSESQNPYDKSMRVAMTGRTMINAQRLFFYVYGEEKREILNKITQPNLRDNFPAGYVIRHTNRSNIFWDR